MRKSFLVLLTTAACSASPAATTRPIEALPANDAGASVADARATDSLPTCAPAPPILDKPGDATCPVAMPGAKDSFDEALAAAGLDRCTLQYTAKDWSVYPSSLARDAYRLPWFDEIHDYPARVPAFGRLLADGLDERATSPLPVTGALQVAAFAFGSKAAPCAPLFDVDAEQPLARAVAKVARDAGGDADDAALEADAADVPRPLQEALAQVVLAAGEAHAAWNDFARDFSPADMMALGKMHAMFLRSIKGPPAITDPKIQTLLSRRFDAGILVEKAAVLALRIERARLGRFVGARGFSFEQETPLGRVVVRDGADHVHEQGSHVLLLVDAGGDDRYLYPAGAVDAVQSKLHHVGLAIDLGGRDEYGYTPVPDPADGKRLPSDGSRRLEPSGPVAEDDGPVSLSETLRQGAARLGFGMLFDFGADGDRYRSLRLSQGYAAAGVGVLFDEGGDDVYEGEAGVQGASHLGVGLLLDAAGNDEYRAFSQTQGFGGVRSVGILYDAQGDDRYVADNGDPADGGDPLYWTPQRPGKGNNSFAQGSAWGRRSPSSDNVDMSGGLGVLRDRKGNDTYVSSVQTQGSGYWFGTGVLADGEGDDSYDARYYVQGAGAHFAMALFFEGGGNDRYNQTLTPTATSIGVGHDYTVAWHLDLGGNDVYRAPVLSLGSGNANGVGILVNVGGDDVYRAAAEPSIGAASFSAEWHEACAPCHAVATTGIFLDVGGNDTYEVASSTLSRGNGKAWENRRSPSDYGVVEHSAGVDRDDGTVTLP